MDSCPEFRPELGAYLLGAISPQDRARLVRHLASCPACRDELAALGTLPGLLRRAPPGHHALDSGNDQILTALGTAAHNRDPNLAMPGPTALLVAESADHRVCRALLALPPAAVMPTPPVPGSPFS